MKFSDVHNNMRQEEIKEEVHYDVNMDEDDSISITPEFNLDNVVTSIREPNCNSPLTREQKKSFKYLNKFK